jgi:cytidine deaminase
MKKMYQEAEQLLDNSRAIYSNFKVSAVIKMKDGTLVKGVNVENASFGLTNCAERTALFNAYTLGYQKEDIVEMLLTTDQDDFISPCGACRQVMRELMPEDTPVHIAKSETEIKTVLNKELLPFAFTEKDL